MKGKILALCLLLLSFTASAQFIDGAVYDDLYDGEVAASLKAHVRELSSAYMEGRKAGSEGEKKAAEYVEQMFIEYGVDIISAKGGELFGIKSADGDTLTSRNVVGFVQGYDKNLRDKYIVIGARLDNLGTVKMTVDGKEVEQIYYGANGNASGLSILIELARKIQTNSILFRRSVLLVAFGASSQTYAGSWYFLNRWFSDVENIDAMVNLDMLGTGDRGFYAYTASNMDLNSLIRKLTGELQPITPDIIAMEPYPSDHRAFYDREIPAVYFTSGKYPEYNSYKDTQSIIDYGTMDRELEYIYNFSEALANLDSEPVFHSEEFAKKSKYESDVVSYNDCDQKPEFFNNPDPRKFLREWVYQYLKYPESAVRNGIQGQVVVDFIIEKDGKVTNVKVVRGVSEELDEEAIRVVMASPKWKAGKVAGEKVRTAMTIPVEFRLEKKGGRGSFGLKK